MKRLLFALFFVSLVAQAQLRFRPDGTFKIVQFTDCHFIKGDVRSEKCLVNMRHVLAMEKPDFVVFTGDVNMRPPAEGFLEPLKAVSESGVPFAFVFGNHDDEQGETNAWLYERAKGLEGNLTGGVMDYGLRVMGCAEDRAKAVLYFFDTHKDGVTKEQVEWYRVESQRHDGVPAWAFMHIPVVEYAQAATTERSFLVGTRGEKVCCPSTDTGLFSAMKERGDVQGIFCGHDHDNDFVAQWRNVLLAYGRYSGGNTQYNNLGEPGGRVIVLREGKKDFETWVRLCDGRKLYEVKYPGDFPKNR